MADQGTFTARFRSRCPACDEPIEPGDQARASGHGGWLHADCGDPPEPAQQEATPGPAGLHPVLDGAGILRRVRMRRMSARCPDCGLRTWDADDLIPGDYVCACNEPDDDAGHGDDWRPIETVDTGGLL